MWYGQRALATTWPERWDVRVCRPSPIAALTDAALCAALDAPVDCPSLTQLAAGRRDACVLVDDLTRPTPAYRILPHLLGRLAAGGLTADRVRLIVAGGAHGPLLGRRLARKIGRTQSAALSAVSHTPRAGLASVAQVPGVGEVRLNQAFWEADLKVALTGVMPHFTCGFSGGAKIVVPGLAGFDTIASLHGRAVDGPPPRVGTVAGNPVRRLLEHAAGAAGLDFCVCCVFTPEACLAAVFCGTVQASHRAACRLACQTYATPVQLGADVGVFNAFPKDTEFIQAMAALNVWADRTDPALALVRPGGTLVVVTACSEGIGSHGLIQHGAPQFRRRDRHGSFRDVLGGRNLLFLAPNVEDDVFHLYYPPTARRFAAWDPLRAALEELHCAGATVAIYPCAALQLPAPSALPPPPREPLNPGSPSPRDADWGP
jgi:nickel-dependent lactate racemase